jgi:hypothetical protein
MQNNSATRKQAILVRAIGPSLLVVYFGTTHCQDPVAKLNYGFNLTHA